MKLQTYFLIVGIFISFGVGFFSGIAVEDFRYGRSDITKMEEKRQYDQSIECFKATGFLCGAVMIPGPDMIRVRNESWGLQ